VRILAGVLGVLALLAVLLGFVFRGPTVIQRTEEFGRRPVSAQRLEQSVTTLCRDYTPRWYDPAEDLDRAADWVSDRLQETGLPVTEQRYRLPEGEYRNVIATRQGTDSTLGVVIIGAHYDAYGKMCGADDNASGVAVLLELARTLPAAAPERTQIFVAFANEEPPLFSSEDMGSHHYLRRLMEDDVEIDLMIALDLVGYYSDEPDSQSYSSPLLGLYYPSTGNFLAVIGDMGAGTWIKRVKRGLRSTAQLPVFSFRGPRLIPGVTWSDHYWFREFDLPGVLVTDTAMLRNPNYHSKTDLPDTLDYARMAEVVQGLHGVLLDE